MCQSYRHSSQGSVKPITIIDGAADWTSKSLKGREHEFTYQFQDADVKELVVAVNKLKARGVSSEDDVKQVGDTRSRAPKPRRD